MFRQSGAIQCSRVLPLEWTGYTYTYNAHIFRNLCQTRKARGDSNLLIKCEIMILAAQYGQYYLGFPLLKFKIE